MIFKSFRLRLTAIYTVAVVFIFSAFVLLLDLQFRRDLMETVDKDLLRAAETEVRKKSEPGLSYAAGDMTAGKLDDESFDFINREGDLLVSKETVKRGWPLNRESVSIAFKGIRQYETVESGGIKYRLLYFPVSADYVLRIGEPLEDVRKAIAGLEKLLFVSLPGMFAVLALASWFLAGKSVDPVIRIKTLSREVRRGKLDKRIEIGLKGREIDDLVLMFNEMLDSIQRSVEAQKRFTSDVSHEIRSPLTSLMGSIEVMLKKKRTPEEYEELLRSNLSDIVRLSKITESLLFLSSADSDMVELRKRRVDINEILRSVIETVSYEGLSLIEQFSEDVEIEGDSDLLERALSNLIGNAIKYTPRGGTVIIMTERDGDSVRITIRDSGIGIPDDEVAHIFERFYRVDKERSRKSGGTGLGLAIAHWIINAHMGRIMVKSELGKGSDFIVVFPAAEDQKDSGESKGI